MGKEEAPLRPVPNPDLAAGGVHRDGGVLADGAVEDGLGELVDEFALHEPFDGTGAVGRIVAVFDHPVLEGRGEGDRYPDIRIPDRWET